MTHETLGTRAVTPRASVLRSASALALGLMLCAAAAQPTRAQETALPASAFIDSIGVNVHLSYTSNVYGQHFEDIVKPDLIALGVHHYRDGALNEDGQTSLYERHNELGAAGIHGEFIFPVTATPAFITAFPGYVDESFEAYEGPNEYDISGDPNWAATLAAFQKTLYTTAKGSAATKSFPVVGPSFGETYYTNKPLLPQVGNLGLYCDYGNGHPYPFEGNGQGPVVAYDTLTWYPSQAQSPSVKHRPVAPSCSRSLRPIFQGKAFEATETGWFTGTDANSVDQATQAKYVPRLYAEYFRKGIARTYLYELLDEGADGHMQHSFGLLNNDGSPKPAFTALQSLIATLADTGEAKSAGTLTYSINPQDPLANVGVNTPLTYHHLLLQKQNGQFFLLIWNDLASSSFARANGTYLKHTARDIKVAPTPATLTFTTPISSITLYTYGADNTLHSSKLAVTSGAASMQITDQVAVLDITSAS